MSLQAMSAVFECSESTLGARLILLALADYADENLRAYPSVGRLGQKAHISKRGARAALRKLEEMGEIVAEGTSEYETVIYRINLREEDSSSGKMATGNGARTSSEPSSEPSSSSLFGGGDAVVDSFLLYLTAMDRPHRAPHPDERKIIRNALKAASGEELARAYLACSRSDFHMKRGKHANRKGGKHNALGKILKPRPSKGETQRSRIDWWLELAAEQEKGTADDGGGYDRFMREG